MRLERSNSSRPIELEVTSWHQVLDIQIVMLMIICLYNFIELGHSFWLQEVDKASTMGLKAYEKLGFTNFGGGHNAWAWVDT